MVGVVKQECLGERCIATVIYILKIIRLVRRISYTYSSICSQNDGEIGLYSYLPFERSLIDGTKEKTKVSYTLRTTSTNTCFVFLYIFITVFLTYTIKFLTNSELITGIVNTYKTIVLANSKQNVLDNSPRCSVMYYKKKRRAF